MNGGKDALATYLLASRAVDELDSLSQQSSRSFPYQAVGADGCTERFYSFNVILLISTGANAHHSPQSAHEHWPTNHLTNSLLPWSRYFAWLPFYNPAAAGPFISSCTMCAYMVSQVMPWHLWPIEPDLGQLWWHHLVSIKPQEGCKPEIRR